MAVVFVAVLSVAVVWVIEADVVVNVVVVVDDVVAIISTVDVVVDVVVDLVVDVVVSVVVGVAVSVVVRVVDFESIARAESVEVIGSSTRVPLYFSTRMHGKRSIVCSTLIPHSSGSSSLRPRTHRRVRSRIWLKN